MFLSGDDEMSDSSAEWTLFGRNRYRIVKDVIVFEPHGAMSLEEAKQLLNATHAIYKEHGFVFCIVDARDAQTSEAPVRRFIAEEGRRRETLGATYIFGANSIIRSFALLWQNMSRLLGRPPAKLLFVRSEQEAWEEIEKARAELLVKAVAG